jgi:hypothetical protein
MLKLVVLACCLTWGGVCGFPTGAPASSCRTMIPSHRSSAQTDPAPFNITVHANGYSPYNQIDVTIRATQPDVTFKGFLLVAKSADGRDIVGSFVTPARHSLMSRVCDGKMMTQSINRPVTSITAKWRAPYRSSGPVVFHATVVEKFSRFWVDVQSAPLNAL